MPSNRQNRIEEEIKRALSQIIRNDVKDDRISMMTTITAVEVTNDLSYATVAVSVLGTEQEKQQTLDGLMHAAAFMRGRLSGMVDIRRTPQLIFKLDDSIEYSLKIAKILDDVHKQDEEKDKQ